MPVVEFCNVERRTKPIDLEIGEKLVIRVWSWDAARILRDARDGYEIDSAENGQPPAYYSISVFALALAEDETIDALVDRLTLHAAEHRRFKWYCLVTESELYDGDFELILNEPPDDHYDIPVGYDDVDDEMVSRLAMIFGDEKIRMRT